MITAVPQYTTSQPQAISAGSAVYITPSSGATAVVEYTLGTAVDIKNNVALWAAWAKGSVTSATQDIFNEVGFLRVTAQNGAVTFDVRINASQADRVQSTSDWGGASKFLQRPGMLCQPGMIPVGPRTTGLVISQKSVTANMNRVWHIPAAPMQSIVLAYDNPGANPIVVTAAIEYPVGTFTPVYFSSGRSLTLAQGAVAYSRPIAIDHPGPSMPVASTDAFFVRTYVTCATSDLSCRSALDYVGSVLPGLTDTVADNGSDLTLGPNTGMSSSNSYMYEPFGIFASSSKYSGPILAGVGDSIGNGQGETSFSMGWIYRAALANHYPMFKVGLPGSGINGFFPEIAKNDYLSRFEGCTHAFVQMGTNDTINGASLVQMQASATKLWRLLSDRGMRVYQATLPPRTSSTDSWATTANQTPNGSGFVGGTASIRSQFNAWVRTLPSVYLAGFVDVANAVESAPDSGTWKPGYTSDGTHPTPTAYIAIVPSAPLLSM